jgi:hypothetical protein
MSETDPKHGFRGGCFEFVVFAQSSRSSHLGKASLDYSAFGQHLEGVQLISLDHLSIVSERLLCATLLMVLLYSIRRER